MTLVHVPCPVCEEAEFSLLHAATISDPREAPERYFSSSRERAGYLSIVRCKGCGLVLQNPRDDAETLARVYASLADDVYDAEEANRARDARQHLDRLEAHHPGRGHVLDLGCASGFFVAAAHGRGWRAQGADASPRAIERARQRCPSARFSVGTLESLEFPPHALDAVTLFDVLEHVDDPLGALTRVGRWLADSGLLALSLPNAESWTARALGPRWVLLLREHLWYFSPLTITQLLDHAGYDVLETRSKWVSFSLKSVAARLGQYPGPLGRGARLLRGSRHLGHVSLRFPMGEMHVIARRRSTRA